MQTHDTCQIYRCLIHIKCPSLLNSYFAVQIVQSLCFISIMHGKTMIFKMLYLMTYTCNLFEIVETSIPTDGMILRLPGATIKFVHETIRCSIIINTFNITNGIPVHAGASITYVLLNNTSLLLDIRVFLVPYTLVILKIPIMGC